MVRCMAITKEGKKRCANHAVEKETFCAMHLKDKSKAGRSRHLTVKKCQKLKRSNKSPFSRKILSPRGSAYGQVYTACRKRMQNYADRLESRKNLPEHLAMFAKDIKKTWIRARLAGKKAAAKKPAAKKVAAKKA